MLKVLEASILHLVRYQLSPVTDVHQFAYKRKRSTLDAVACLAETVMSSLDKGCRQFKCIFFDFSSAFSTIPRQRLLTELSTPDFPPWLVPWLHNYFLDRSQFTSAGGKQSSSRTNNCGVPQGAVLSPTLFTFFTRSLHHPDVAIFQKYADDVVIGHPAKSADDYEKLGLVVHYVKSWSDDRGLILNPTKSVQCTFSLKRPTSIRAVTLTEADPIAEVSSVKYLGVSFDSNTSWGSQVSHVFHKCLRLSFYVKRLRHLCVPHPVICRFVDACVIPVITYCSPVIFPGLRQQDFRTLKRAIKIISSSTSAMESHSPPLSTKSLKPT